MPKPVKTDEDSDKRKIFDLDLSAEKTNGRLQVTGHVSWRRNIHWKTLLKKLAWLALPSGGLLAILRHFGIL